MSTTAIEMHEVDSSAVQAVGYDVETQTLRVRFNSGHTYDYQGVPQGTYDELMAVDSVGRFLHRHIKGVYQGVRCPTP